MRGPRGSKGAFSLLEIMLTLGLLSIVFVIVFTVLIGGLQMQTRAESVEVASSIAREMLERIKTLPFSVSEGSYDGRVPNPPTALDFPPAPYPAVERGALYYVKVDVVARDERLWQVSVSVSTADRLMTSVESFLRR
ncbi:MAG: type II secretion system protein [Vulcanimicrobiota bacterium]